MVVTATNFKAKIGKYLDNILDCDVYITKNGKLVARLSNPSQDKQFLLDSLVGITAHNPVSLEEARQKRLSKQAGNRASRHQMP